MSENEKLWAFFIAFELQFLFATPFILLLSRGSFTLVFIAHHNRDTYLEREAGETANDRNDRAIRVAVKWYDLHLSASQAHVSAKKRIRIVLLTDDAANCEKATKEGLFAASGN